VFDWKKKVKTLLLPYLFWGVLYQTFLWGLGIIGGAPVWETFGLRLGSLLKLEGGPVWFLCALFIATICFGFLIKNVYVSVGVSLALLCLSWFVPRMENIAEAFLRAFAGCIFMVLGFWGISIWKIKANNWLIFVAFFVHIVLMRLNPIIDMSSREYGNLFLYLLNACLGTWIILQMAMKLDGASYSNCFMIRMLKCWGRKSVIILCIHPFIIQMIRLADYKIFHNVLSGLGIFEGIIISVIVMGILTVFLPSLYIVFGWTWGMKGF